MKHIAIDLGAESGRVIVGDLTGLDIVRKFPSKIIHINGHLHWDVHAIFSEIKMGMKEAFARYGDEIASVGVDSWGVDYGLLDDSGRLLSEPFHYRDLRNNGIMEELIERFGRRRIYERTGIAFLSINTLYQLVADKRAGFLGKARRLLNIPDLMHYWLSGVQVNEFSIATTTQCYDSRKSEWADDILSDLGIPTNLFDNVVMPGSILGTLSPKVTDTVKAPANVQVIVPAGHDTGSAVVAVPDLEDESAAYISSGTWSLLGTVLSKPNIGNKAMEANFTNEGAAEGDVRFLKNIMGLWILQECKRQWDTEDRQLDYEQIIHLAEDKALQTSSKQTFHIDVNDRRFLHPGSEEDSMTSRIEQYCRKTGQLVPSGVGEIAWGIFSSLASSYAETLKSMSNITGKNFDRLYIIGGGSKNRMLNRLTAVACGIPVSAGPVEATALGSILIQSKAYGSLKSLDEGREIIRRDFPLS